MPVLWLASKANTRPLSECAFLNRTSKGVARARVVNTEMILLGYKYKYMFMITAAKSLMEPLSNIDCVSNVHRTGMLISNLSCLTMKKMNHD